MGMGMGILQEKHTKFSMSWYNITRVGDQLDYQDMRLVTIMTNCSSILFSSVFFFFQQDIRRLVNRSERDDRFIALFWGGRKRDYSMDIRFLMLLVLVAVIITQ